MLSPYQANAVKSNFLYLLDELIPYEDRNKRIEEFKKDKEIARLLFIIQIQSKWFQRIESESVYSIVSVS